MALHSTFVNLTQSNISLHPVFGSSFFDFFARSDPKLYLRAYGVASVLDYQEGACMHLSVRRDFQYPTTNLSCLI